MNKLIYIASLILITACQKWGNGYVRGTVYEAASGSPISGIKVYVTDTKYGSTHENFTSSAITNANGEYTIYYYKKKYRRYFLKCEATNDYTSCMFEELKFKKFAYTLEMYPHAYLKIRVKKTAYSLNTFSGRLNGNIDIGTINNQYPYDTLLPTVFKVNGNDYNMNIEWYINFNNSSTPNHSYNYDKIYIPKNDTLLYTIIFN